MNYKTQFTPSALAEPNSYIFDTHHRLTPLGAIGVDGVDHINISDEGATELGRSLSHSAKIPFDHSHYGQFVSMNNFWYYIRSVERDDRLRSFYGKRLRMCVDQATTSCRVPNFRVLIMDANWQKTQQSPGLLDMLGASAIPFDCWYRYRRDGGIVVRPNFAHWLIAGFEEIRKAVKNSREPDFAFLRDTQDTDIYKAADIAATEALTKRQN